MGIQLMTPSGSSVEALTPPKVPVHRDRDFFIESEQTKYETAMGGEVLIPIGPNSMPMSPFEASTGVVLPILPQRPGRRNRHHPHFFEWIFEGGDLGDKALRYSRLQYVTETDHNAYHARIKGTLVRRQQEHKFGMLMLNLAGYIPRFGVRPTNRNIWIEEIPEDTRQFMRASNTFRPQTDDIHQAVTRDYVMAYALSHDFSLAKQAEAEEFLSITQRATELEEAVRERKLELGVKLTNYALALAVEPLHRIFADARNNGMFQEGGLALAWDTAKHQVKGHEGEYISAIEARLTTGALELAA